MFIPKRKAVFVAFRVLIIGYWLTDPSQLPIPGWPPAPRPRGPTHGALDTGHAPRRWNSRLLSDHGLQFKTHSVNTAAIRFIAIITENVSPKSNKIKR